MTNKQHNTISDPGTFDDDGFRHVKAVHPVLNGEKGTGNSSSSDTPKEKKKNNKSKNNWSIPVNTKIIVPEKAREFLTNEIEYLKQIPYLKKTLGRNPIAMGNIKFLITILELNGGLKRKGAMLAKTELSKIFGSFNRLHILFDTLLEYGIVECVSKHYNTVDKQARRYILTETWKFLKLHKKCPVRTVIKKPISKPKKEQIQILKQEEPIIEEPQPKPTMKPEIIENENQNEVEDDSDEMRIAESVVLKYNTHFWKKKLRAIGIDPNETQICECCQMDLPKVLFSIASSSKTVHKKCRICYELESFANPNAITNNSDLNNVARFNNMKDYLNSIN